MRIIYKTLYNIIPTFVEVYNLFQIKKSFRAIVENDVIQKRYRIPEIEDKNIKVNFWGTLYLCILLPIGVRSVPEDSLSRELEDLNYVLYGSGMHGLIEMSYDVYFNSAYDVYYVKYSPIFKWSSALKTLGTLGSLILTWIYKTDITEVLSILWK